jgi:SAM-dependent methyltransferase
MWDQRFAEPGYAYGTEPNDFLAEQIGQLASPVLSLGEGEGRNAVFLATRGLEVTAVDGSRVGLDKARALAAERGVALRTVVADLADFVIDEGAWGGIVSIWCHLPPALHAACVRGLRPGGAFLLEAYSLDQLKHGTGGPRDASMLVTLDGLRRELAGLDLEVGRELVREVHEGRLHQGTSAVVQVVARKR